MSVAEPPGAILPVCTIPEGVLTDSACVTAPPFLTVIVILPVPETVALDGVILNSVSVNETCLPEAVAAADDELAEVEGLELLDEPQPASSAATATGATAANRCIPRQTPAKRRSFPRYAQLMSNERPVIGITTGLTRAQWGPWDRRAALLAFSYITAIQDAGAIALMIPPDPNLIEEPDQALARIDGLILSGGNDVDPASYGAQAHPSTDAPVPERDRTEIALSRRAVELDMPVLGICRGMQVLNVAYGGTLNQHLPDDVGHEDHRRHPGTFDDSDHDVRLRPGSLAARVAGEEHHNTKSHHHQGVAVIGDGLEVTGISTLDQLPEAIEAPEHEFVLGVQWHPEADEQSRVISGLVEQAKRYRNTRGSA